VPEPGALRTVLAFPSTYTVGITSLGYQIVWATLAMRPDLDVRRLFTDQGDPRLERIGAPPTTQSTITATAATGDLRIN